MSILEPRRSGSQLSKPKRFVWHPLVHSVSQQRLTFFIVRVETERSTEILDVVEGFMTAHRVRWWNAYSVYGFHDVVIRCWLPSNRPRDLRLHMEERLRWSVFQFDTEQVKYLWKSVDEATSDVVGELAPAIRRVNALGSTALNDTEDVKLLVERGIAKPVPEPKSPHSIKLYVLLRATERLRINSSKRLERNLSRVLSRDRNLVAPTIHRSLDGHILIKTRVLRFRYVQKLLRTVEGQLDPDEYGTVTLLVADSRGDENDVIEDGDQPLSPPLSMLANICGEKVSTLLTKAPERARTDIQQLYSRHVETFSKAKSYLPVTRAPLDALNELLVYRIERSGLQFSGPAATLVALLERALADVLPKLFAKALGEKWFVVSGMRERLRALHVQPKQGRVNATIGDGSIGQMERLLQDLFREGIVSVIVMNALGDNVLKVLSFATPARNEIQHGYVADEMPQLLRSEEWVEWASSYVELVQLYLACIGIRNEGRE